MTDHRQQDPIPGEADFSNAERGKLYRPNIRLHLPGYLGQSVAFNFFDPIDVGGRY